MVKFALAGAGKTIGKAIHQFLLENDLYDYIILSRAAKDDGRTIAVDYSNIEAMAKVLDEHKIHTVISAVSVGSDEGGKSQLNLIEAAIQSKTVQRFMPSEFGARYTKEWLKVVPQYAWKFKAIDRLAESRLEYTLFSNAQFMDYAFSPRIPSAFPEAEFSWIDFDNHVASIPGDGNTPFVNTHSRDIPKYVMKVLELPKWDTRYFLIGDRLTFNEYVTLAEEVKGVKFERLYNPISELQKGKVNLVSSMTKQLPEGFEAASVEQLMSGLGLQMAEGQMDLPFETEGTLVNNMYSELQTLKVKDALEMYFSKNNAE